MGEKKIASFLHLSDVHLGKRNTISNKDGRFEDFFRAFNNGIEFAIDKHTDFILISGDLFDSRQPSPVTVERCEQILNKAVQNNIDIFCVEGNHDLRKTTEKMSWIDYLQEKGVLIHLNTDYDDDNKLQVITYDKDSRKGTIFRHPSGINIVGLGWLGLNAEDKIAKIFEELEGSNNIIMLHAMLESFDTTDFGVIRKHIFESYLDKFLYVALGHGHVQKSYLNKLYNAGSPEYVELRDFRNPKRGYYYVEVYQGDNGDFTVKPEHIVSKKRNYLPIKVDVTGFDDGSFLQCVTELILDSWSKEIEEPLVDITFYGYAPELVNHRLPLKEIEESLSVHRDYLAISFSDDIDWYSDSSLSVRSGGSGQSLSFDERCRVMMIETMIRFFDDKGSLVKINPIIAEQLTDSLWDKYEELKSGLSDEKKDEFFENLHNVLWSEENED